MSFILFTLAQLSSNQPMVQPDLPEVLWGSWEISEENCVNEDSLTRIEFGRNWMRDNLGQGILQFATPIAASAGFDAAIEARFVMGDRGGIRDVQVRLHFGFDGSRPVLSWMDSIEGYGYIDDEREPVGLVKCVDDETIND